MDVAMMTLRWQRWLLLGTLVASAVVMWPHGIDNFDLPKATVVVLAALASLWLTAVRCSWWRRLVVPRSPAVIAAAVFAAGITLATVTSTSRLQSVVGQHNQYDGLALYLACVILFVAAVRAFDAGTAHLLLRAFVVAMVVVVAYGLVQVAHADPIHWHVAHQVSSTFSNTNFLAGWLAIAFGPCAVVAAAPSQPLGWRLAADAALVGGVVVLQQTGAFQGPVAAGAGLAVALAGVVWVRRRPWVTPRNLVVAGVVLVVVAAAGVAVGHSYLKRSIDAGLYDRKAYWSGALHTFEDHPVVGTGPDTFHDQFLRRRPVGHVGNNGGAAHDVPLDLLANGGVVTGLPYLAFLGLVGFALVRAARRASGDTVLVVAGIGAAWTAYVVQSLVSIDKPALALAHWVVAGVAVALTRPEEALVRLPGALDGRRLQLQGSRWYVPAGVATVVALVALVPLTRPERADAAVAAAVREMNHHQAGPAIRDVEKGRRLAPWEADHTFYAAQIYLATGRKADALATAEKGARLKPGDAVFSAFAARMATATGDTASSARWWAETVRRDPWGSASLHDATMAAARRKDRATVEALVPRVKRISALSGWVLEGDALRTLGDKSGARAAYEEALRLDPANAVVRKALRKLGGA